MVMSKAIHMGITRAKIHAHILWGPICVYSSCWLAFCVEKDSNEMSVLTTVNLAWSTFWESCDFVLRPRSLTDDWGWVNTSGLPLQGASLMLCYILWDLCWREWHWDGFVSQYPVFPCQCHSTSAPYLTWLAPMPHVCNNSQHPSVIDSTEQFSNIMISWNEQCENVISRLLCVSTGV